MADAAQGEDLSGLVLGLLKGVPSDPFEFKKIQADGSSKSYPVRVQLLRLEQNHQVLREAQAYAKAQGEAPGSYGDMYKEAQAVELVTLALRRTELHTLPDGTTYYPPVFTDAKQLRSAFTSAEIAQCLNMYELVKAKYGALESLSEDEIGLWRDRLADTLRGPLFLSLLGSDHWPELIFSLAREARDLRLQIGLPLSTSLDTSESDPPSSTDSTGSFSELPEAFSESGDPLPVDRILTPEEASRRARDMLKPKT